MEICEKMVNNYDRRTYKNIKRGERMKERAMAIIARLGILGYAVIMCLIAMSNKYEKDIQALRKQNKELQQINMTLYENNQQGCDCTWLQSFYDEWHESVGVFE